MEPHHFPFAFFAAFLFLCNDADVSDVSDVADFEDFEDFDSFALLPLRRLDRADALWECFFEPRLLTFFDGFFSLSSGPHETSGYN